MKFANPSIYVASGIGVAAAVGLAALFFSPLRAVFVLLQAALTFFWAAVGTAFLLLAAPIDLARPVYGVFVSYSEILFAAVILAWLARAATRGGAVDRFFQTDWRLLVWSLPFLSAVTLSGLVNISALKVIPHLLRISETFLALWLAAAVFRASGRGLFEWTVGAAAVLHVGLGAVDLFADGLPQMVSTFSNANQLAGFLLLLSPFAAVLSAESEGARRWLWSTLTALLLITLLLTGSRVATAVSLVSVLWVWRKAAPRKSSVPRARTISKAAAAAVLVAALAVGAGLLSGNLGSVLRAGRSAAADYSPERVSMAWSQRWAFYRLGLTVWSAQPLLGIGPGRYDDVYPRYASTVEETRRRAVREQELQRPGPKTVQARVDRRMAAFSDKAVTHVHNLFLQLAVDFGVLGLAGFLAWAVLLWRRLRRLGSRPWTLAARAMFAAFLAHNLLDVTWPSLGLEFGILMGAGLALSHTEADGKRPFSAEASDG